MSDVLDLIDIAIEDDRWAAIGFGSLSMRAISETLAHQGIDAKNCEISVLACNDVRIADLNAEFRGKPTPTNVLSWPSEDLAATQPGAQPDPPAPDFTGEISLGDIAIAWDTCAREAVEQDKSMADHVTHLIIHGTLHLLGYDHIRDADATLMERLEVEILGKLGIDDPYSAERVP